MSSETSLLSTLKVNCAVLLRLKLNFFFSNLEGL